MNKKCVICKKIFEKTVKESMSEWQKRKYCSYDCYWDSRKGHTPWNKGKSGEYHLWPNGRVYSSETLKKMSESHKGKKQSKELIEKRIKRRSEHYAWKGDNVGYGALHSWVKKELGKPSTCEYCEKSGLEGMKINWANKSGKYLRRHDDWIRLCASCHRKYDYQMRKNTK